MFQNELNDVCAHAGRAESGEEAQTGTVSIQTDLLTAFFQPPSLYDNINTSILAGPQIPSTLTSEARGTQITPTLRMCQNSGHTVVILSLLITSVFPPKRFNKCTSQMGRPCVKQTFVWPERGLSKSGSDSCSGAQITWMHPSIQPRRTAQQKGWRLLRDQPENRLDQLIVSGRM